MHLVFRAVLVYRGFVAFHLDSIGRVNWLEPYADKLIAYLIKILCNDRYVAVKRNERSEKMQKLLPCCALNMKF